MSSTPVTAITAPPAIPLFTPASNCFDHIWAEVQPCDGDGSTTCTIFSLGRNDGYEVNENACLTATFGTQHLPGTNCPISYTNVDSSTTVSSSITTGTLTCCPSHQSFTYTVTGSNSVGRCAAVSPSLPGSRPWTVKLSRDSRNSGSSPTITSSAVLDPAQDPLIAPALFMTYVVQDGVTCAPNCQSPYHSSPTSTPSATGCDTMCRLGRGVFITVILVPIVAVILIVAAVCWCCLSTKRRDPVPKKDRETSVSVRWGT